MNEMPDPLPRPFMFTLKRVTSELQLHYAVSPERYVAYQQEEDDRQMGDALMAALRKLNKPVAIQLFTSEEKDESLQSRVFRTAVKEVRPPCPEPCCANKPQRPIRPAEYWNYGV